MAEVSVSTIYVLGCASDFISVAIRRVFMISDMLYDCECSVIFRVRQNHYLVRQTIVLATAQLGVVLV